MKTFTSGKIVLAFLVLSFAASHAKAQTAVPAPTVAQCRADDAEWFNESISNTSAMATPFRVWVTRFAELNQCLHIDSANLTGYNETMNQIASTLGDREMSFLKRHGLATQFLDEDDAGKR